MYPQSPTAADRRPSCRPLVFIAVMISLPLAAGEPAKTSLRERSRMASRAAPAGEASSSPVLFPLKIADPTFPEAPPRELQLVQARDSQGFPVGYALRVMTRVCMDNKCRAVDVTLHWDAVGSFERLECAPGKPLTKKEHEPFTAADYAKLDRILKDRSSILGRQSLAFLAKPKEERESAEIDAWSGATPLTVQESVVQDAAYTSWVLWRWANGPVTGKICEFTERSCNPVFLARLLRSGNHGCAAFALRVLGSQPGAAGRHLDDVLHVVETGDRELITTALRVLKAVPGSRESIYARLVGAASRMRAADSPIVLDFLAAEPELPAATLEELTGYVGQIPYFQVHLTLRILEQRKFCSAKTEADVARLLDGGDFFVARRASEFLAKQQLSEGIEAKLKSFRERYRDRL